MSSITLSPAERRAKRAEAHHLTPLVFIGNAGLTPSVRKEIDAALTAHGLIKVRVFSDERAVRESMLLSLVEELGAASVQHIGKLLVLWRPIPEKVKVERDDRMPGPKIVKILKFSKSGNHRAQVKKIKVLGNERVTAAGELKRARKRQTSNKKTAPD